MRKVFEIPHLFSTIDYPNGNSLVLFLPGCTMSCPYCHNIDIARAHPITGSLINSLTPLLRKYGGFTQNLVFSGGEPTMYGTRLIEAAEYALNLGWNIKLDSNSSCSQSLFVECLDLFDIIALDVKTVPTKYHRVFKKHTPIVDTVCSNIRHAASLGSDNIYFRTTMDSRIVDILDIHNVVMNFIVGAKHYYIQQLIDPSEHGYPCNELGQLVNDIKMTSNIDDVKLLNC